MISATKAASYREGTFMQRWIKIQEKDLTRLLPAGSLHLSAANIHRSDVKELSGPTKGAREAACHIWRMLLYTNVGNALQSLQNLSTFQKLVLEPCIVLASASLEVPTSFVIAGIECTVQCCKLARKLPTSRATNLLQFTAPHLRVIVGI